MTQYASVCECEWFVSLLVQFTWECAECTDHSSSHSYMFDLVCSRKILTDKRGTIYTQLQTGQ